MEKSELPRVNGNRVDAAEDTSASEVCPSDNKGDALELWATWLAESGPEDAHPRRCFRWQRAVDLLAAMLLLLPCLPIIALLVLLVRLTSRGPGIYPQLRIGMHGRNFWMYKIRTMRPDAEGNNRAAWAKKDDPRVTPVGRILRNLHLDEFPQLFNVLKGDMSLVGPRPERPEFVHVLAKRIPDYLNRLAVRPGIAGLAQVNLEPDVDLDSVRKKLVLDLEYVRYGSLWLDARVLSSTLIHLLGVSGERAKHLTRLHRDVKPATLDHTAATAPPVPAIFPALAMETTGNGNGNGNGKATSNGRPLNAFTVDVEDYFQVSGFEDNIRRIEWDSFAPRVESSTRRLLALLDRHEVKATFFILGWVARRHARLVREIHAAGHEIGSHGYWHRLIYTQRPDEFQRDLRHSYDVLTNIIGEDVVAYRAPSFSVTNQSLWALDVLAEEGFLVDSSVVPVYHDRYGIPGAKPNIHMIETPSGRILECPPAIKRCGRWNLPVGGGGYFRLYPLGWTIRCLKKINRKMRQPFLFYVHPWEVDPDQPRLDVGTSKSRFRHRVNLSSTECKLNELLEEFRFGRLRDVIQKAGFNVRRNAGDKERELVELAVEV